MGDKQGEVAGPDFAQGIALAGTQGLLLGHVDKEPVLLARSGDEFLAIGATCTHYGGPLAEGLLVEDTVRCPWHHACFSLRTGEALRAPALKPVACWDVEQRDGRVYVSRKKQPTAARPISAAASTPTSIVILGGGAAAAAAAEMLRRKGYAGRLTMLSTDQSQPYDRPNLSKDYLAGNAQEDWLPLFSPSFYTKHSIELRLGTRATAIDAAARQVHLDDGSSHDYDALLIATGAEPVRLQVPGAELAHVHYLRTLADSRALIAKSKTARRAVVIGSSFIGLEVAASLRKRGVEVHVVGRETRPLERVMGAEIADLIREIHQENGVSFDLGTTVAAIDEKAVTLSNGKTLQADLVVVGIGVKPMTALAEDAGLAMDRGIAVNEYLETSTPGIFAAGDLARWPDRLTGDRIRVEHWVVAERQGQTAALNMIGQRQRFDAVPFFWSQHYDTIINYVGHAERWDQVEIDGRVDARNCSVTYRRNGRQLAVATISRDLDNLRAELQLERIIATCE
jgi:NADPH-dependent 2,4-dienoyl-CoA reductase/sulfur reductase-like enzyme/nitrite reductase/ring-hydroxylating ferredoxin subunit